MKKRLIDVFDSMFVFWNASRSSLKNSDTAIDIKAVIMNPKLTPIDISRYFLIISVGMVLFI